MLIDAAAIAAVYALLLLGPLTALLTVVWIAFIPEVRRTAGGAPISNYVVAGTFSPLIVGLATLLVLLAILG